MVNQWYVITGAPSSGKTSTISTLETRGYRVVYELARAYIDEELVKGKLLTDLRKDELEFQQIVLQRKVDAEKTLALEEVVFFDRGIPDSIAYYQITGHKPDNLLRESVKNCSYQRVFILNLLDYERDYARIESENEAKLLDNLLEKAYQDSGFSVLRVPNMALEDRVSFILENLVIS